MKPEPDFDMNSDDPSEPGEPLRCAYCLIDAIHDSDIGTTSRSGFLAVTIHKGTAFCMQHLRERLSSLRA